MTQVKTCSAECQTRQMGSLNDTQVPAYYGPTASSQCVHVLRVNHAVLQVLFLAAIKRQCGWQASTPTQLMSRPNATISMQTNGVIPCRVYRHQRTCPCPAVTTVRAAATVVVIAVSRCCSSGDGGDDGGGSGTQRQWQNM